MRLNIFCLFSESCLLRIDFCLFRLQQPHFFLQLSEALLECVVVIRLEIVVFVGLGRNAYLKVRLTVADPFGILRDLRDTELSERVVNLSALQRLVSRKLR